MKRNLEALLAIQDYGALNVERHLSCYMTCILGLLPTQSVLFHLHVPPWVEGFALLLQQGYLLEDVYLTDGTLVLTAC